MSIPWSAPEVLLDETTGTVQSEVWSLAATLYTLLAGRSPFEVVDGSNASEALIGRISRARVPSLDRDDVPEALEAVLPGFKASFVPSELGNNDKAAAAEPGAGKQEPESTSGQHPEADTGGTGSSSLRRRRRKGSKQE